MKDFVGRNKGIYVTWQLSEMGVRIWDDSKDFYIYSIPNPGKVLEKAQ
jgi:hypothetical protein